MMLLYSEGLMLKWAFLKQILDSSCINNTTTVDGKREGADVSFIKLNITAARALPVGCMVGWVNLYQKFEIEKYTVCGKLILPKKMENIFLKLFWHNWHADLHGFANICKLPVSHTF